MIKETIIRMGALIQCSLKGEANSKGRLFEGRERECANSSICNIPVIARVIP